MAKKNTARKLRRHPELLNQVGGMMTYFLLEYHRPSGELRTLDEYDDGYEAMGRRFALERDKDADTEAVVLSAVSLDTIRQTHSRYF